jgi:hypothetical protein
MNLVAHSRTRVFAVARLRHEQVTSRNISPLDTFTATEIKIDGHEACQRICRNVFQTRSFGPPVTVGDQLRS